MKEIFLVLIALTSDGAIIDHSEFPPESFETLKECKEKLSTQSFVIGSQIQLGISMLPLIYKTEVFALDCGTQKEIENAIAIYNGEELL